MGRNSGMMGGISGMVSDSSGMAGGSFGMVGGSYGTVRDISDMLCGHANHWDHWVPFCSVVFL